ncbi:MAG: hypothetical protein HQL59_06225 [Magnetococcales bacterium]|nr:hypothetical protein [Magnetococcales bacterium]
MSLAERIQHEVSRLPEPLVREVLDFIGYLEYAHRQDRDLDLLKEAQRISMRRVWDNPTDEAWNDL